MSLCAFSPLYLSLTHKCMWFTGREIWRSDPKDELDASPATWKNRTHCCIPAIKHYQESWKFKGFRLATEHFRGGFMWMNNQWDGDKCTENYFIEHEGESSNELNLLKRIHKWCFKGHLLERIQYLGRFRKQQFISKMHNWYTIRVFLKKRSTK